jgi:hypothetical protein
MVVKMQAGNQYAQVRARSGTSGSSEGAEALACQGAPSDRTSYLEAAERRHARCIGGRSDQDLRPAIHRRGAPR